MTAAIDEALSVLAHSGFQAMIGDNGHKPNTEPVCRHQTSSIVRNITMLNTKSLLALVVASLLVGGCKSEKPEDQVNSAKEYLQKSDTKAATIQLKNALQQKPDLAEARFLLGTVFRDEGNFTAAEIEFRKALTAQYPANLVVPELARAMMVIGQGKKLAEEFGTVQFNQSAANANLQTTLAAAYGELGNQQSAEVALTAALAADPDYGPALLVRSRQKAARQDFDGALSVIDKVVAKDAGNFEAWKLKGDILQFSKNDTDGALLAYKKSIDINPKFIPSHSEILTILLQKGKNAEAAKQLDQLKKVAPKNLEVKYFESFIAYQNKDYKSAKDLVQQLLRSAPNNGRILNLAGAIELQMKSYSQAEIYLLRSIKMTPDLGLSHRLLVATYASSVSLPKH